MVFPGMRGSRDAAGIPPANQAPDGDARPRVTFSTNTLGHKIVDWTPELTAALMRTLDAIPGDRLSRDVPVPRQLAPDSEEWHPNGVQGATKRNVRLRERCTRRSGASLMIRIES